MSTKKVFDIVVDGENAEVKTKKGNWDKFDFIGITKNQFAAMESKELKRIYLVLNANEPNNIDVIELKASDLLKSEYTIDPTYYWSKKAINSICSKEA